MDGRAGILVGALAGMLLTGSTPLAQTALQPTPKPIVTVENEVWYQAGMPITVNGNTYYPTGPQVYFNGNEMVRSGHFQGIPLYSRTTLEPYSIVFAPLSGGLMQPYERRRSGEIADTVGSLSPSFPVVRSAEQSGMEYVPGAGMVQAQAPPSRVGEIVDRQEVDSERTPVVTAPRSGRPALSPDRSGHSRPLAGQQASTASSSNSKAADTSRMARRYRSTRSSSRVPATITASLSSDRAGKPIPSTSRRTPAIPNV